MMICSIASISPAILTANEITLDCSGLEIENTRPPIDFIPFLMEDPITGKEYTPEEILIIEHDNGETIEITAKNFFDQLNQIESGLNKIGY